MKLQTLLPLATAASSTSAFKNPLPNEISATSDLGRSLLSHARRLENDDDAVDYTWVANYSLKFQGCRHHTSLNLEADDNNDVRIKTTHLAHFRLCPSNSCSSWLGGGCNSNYGDYVVDLETFAKTFVEGQRRSEEFVCQNYMYENCDCQETDDKGDDFNREYCEYDCYANSKKYQSCVDRNPYEEEEEGGQRNERFEPQRYVECKEWEFNADADDDGNQNNGDDDNQVAYYVGPYCSNDGGNVYLGLYTDDTCTNFADTNHGHTTFKELEGSALPYSTTSLITSDCISCIEQEDPNRRDENDDDAVDVDEVSDQCERLYESAGKCESKISSGMVSDPNNAACSYIGGIKFTKLNGTVDKSMTSNELATFMIILFAGMFGGLALFVFKLHKSK